MAALRQVWRSWNWYSSTLVRPAMLRYSTSVNVKRSDGSHYVYSEPPNGFLFNEKPLLPGEKRQKEEWENIWVYGMGSCFILMFIVAIFKPHTGIDVWAREKAKERLGEKDDYY